MGRYLIEKFDDALNDTRLLGKNKELCVRFLFTEWFDKNRGFYLIDTLHSVPYPRALGGDKINGSCYKKII